MLKYILDIFDIIEILLIYFSMKNEIICEYIMKIKSINDVNTKTQTNIIEENSNFEKKSSIKRYFFK